MGSGCRTGRWGRGAGCVFSAVGAGGKGPGFGDAGGGVGRRVEGVRSRGVLPGPWQALDLAAVMQFSSICSSGVEVSASRPASVKEREQVRDPA